jgi:hypothetical protein
MCCGRSNQPQQINGGSSENPLTNDPPWRRKLGCETNLGTTPAMKEEDIAVLNSWPAQPSASHAGRHTHAVRSEDEYDLKASALVGDPGSRSAETTPWVKAQRAEGDQ